MTAPQARKQHRSFGRPSVKDPIKVVQPPAQFAHLSGDALHKALTSDPEQWDRHRLAAESGRSIHPVMMWVRHRYSVDAWAKKKAGDPGYQHDEIVEVLEDDRTVPTPDGFHGNLPWWTAGHLRTWMMQVGLMRRDGTFIPHKPAGRRKGTADIGPRPKRPSLTRAQGPLVLAEYRQLRDPAGPHKMTQAQAWAQLAEQHHLSLTQVKKRIEVGRAIENGRIT